MAGITLPGLNETAEGPLLYEEFRPANERIESAWRFAMEDPHDPPQAEHIIVPDGLVSVQASIADDRPVGIRVLGPGTGARIVTVERGTRFAGLRLWPGVAAGLLDTSPETLRDDAAPLPERHQGWVAHALAAIWSGRNCELPTARCDARVLTAARAIRDRGGMVVIEALAAEAGLSARQFRDRFGREAGLSPKAFAQVRRQREAWIALVTRRSGSLTAASHDAGYADQAHFTRAARAAFGARPLDILAYVGSIRHRFGWLERA